ncbi:sphingomyelin phosphodiesterase [Anaeramoeba flamelloides]|uniref:Sphingomyelin phosphodiesterase n=1 Tax=Anaeramoeba flamelloides TaxID=1746091 RepID=A0AAV7YIK3_9EUKA|nr:sphingomyelin phosphodiesterase [Anaeramoeba flamelloides]
MKFVLLISILVLLVLSVVESSLFGKFLVINDVHVDKNYEEGSMVECTIKCPCCCQSPPSANYTGQKATKWGSINCNTPFVLFEQLIPQIQKQPVDFIVFLGDMPYMGFWDVDYADTISYIMFLSQELSKLADIPVIPVLGNHDYSPADQFNCHPDMADYYKTMATLYQDWIIDKDNFLKCGYYSQSIIPGLRFLIINGMLCDPANLDAQNRPQDWQDQIDWLDEEIAKAKLNGEKVYIFGHIPVGKSSRRVIPPLCYTNSSLKLAQVMEKYPDTIVAMFSGHTHFDEFRVIYDTKTFTKPVGMNLISPSFVPEGNRYSGFRVYDYDKNNFDITNIHQWYSDTYNVPDNEIPYWNKFFDFNVDYQRFGIDKINPEGLDKLVKMIQTDPDVFKFYYSRYAPKWDFTKVTLQNEKLIKCSLALTSNEIYSDCFDN